MTDDEQAVSQISRHNQEILASIMFLWRSKSFWIAGILVGIAVGYFYVGGQHASVYATYLPLKIDLKPSEDIDELLNDLNEELSLPQTAGAIFDKAKSSDAVFGEYLAATGWTRAAFVSTQTGTFGERLGVVKFLKNGTRSATLYLKLPSSDSSGRIGRSLAKATSLVFEDYIRAKGAAERKVNKGSDLVGLSSLTRLRALLVSRYREKSGIELRLISLEEQLGLPAVRASDQSKMRNMIEADRQQRILRRLAELQVSGKIGLAQGEAFQTQLAAIRADSDIAELRFSQSVSVAEEQVKGDIKEFEVQPENAVLASSFAIDDLKLQRMDGRNSERVQSKFPLFATAGGIFGAILALLMFGLKERITLDGPKYRVLKKVRQPQSIDG